jgi:hypothetical protein
MSLAGIWQKEVFQSIIYYVILPVEDSRGYLHPKFLPDGWPTKQQDSV